jgi:hypothetical protein
MRKGAISILAMLALAGCGPSHPDAQPPASATAGARPRADTAGMGAALAQAGFTLDSVLSSHGTHVAVTARRRADGGLHVAVLREGEGRYRMMGADPLLEDVPPQRVSWPSFPAGAAFAYTHDVPAEGLVSTVARTLGPDSLPLLYVDPGRVCRPAEFRDLDGDGTAELIAYPEEASGGDCSSECHLALRDRFDGGPHWTAVQRWTADGWRPAEDQHPGFYREVAERYRRMHAWVSARPAACSGREPWLRTDPGVFARWAQRAETLSAAR